MNFTVPYKKHKALDKLQELWLTSSKKKKKMPINNMLNLKNRFVRKRSA